MSYLLTGLAGCSVDLEISCGARKLAWTPRVTKKKVLYSKISNFGTTRIYLLGMKIKLTVGT